MQYYYMKSIKMLNVMVFVLVQMELEREMNLRHKSPVHVLKM